MSWPKGRSRREYNNSHPNGSNRNHQEKVAGRYLAYGSPNPPKIVLSDTQIQAKALEALEKTNQITRERPWISNVFPTYHSTSKRKWPSPQSKSLMK
jgi:hypothetical protein